MTPGSGDPHRLLSGPVIGHLAVVDDAGPYVTPICIAGDEGRLVFHTGEGRRSRALADDDRICLSVTADVRLHPGDAPCNVGYDYRSVLVFGRARLLTESREREEALDLLVAAHYPRVSGGAYDQAVLAETLVYEVLVDEVTFKERPRRPSE